MSLSRKHCRNFRSWTTETSRLAHAAKARKRMAGDMNRIDRPAAGLLLKTIHITDHPAGRSVEIKIRQGRRLNQVVAETFGRPSAPMGTDRLMREIRKRLLVTRWMHE